MIRHFVCLVAMVSCGGCGDTAPTSAGEDPGTGELDRVAERYLFLELSMGVHDADHVDAYFGPGEIRDAAERDAASLEQIAVQARSLTAELRDRPTGGADIMQDARVEGMIHRLGALLTRIAMKQGESIPFDEESRRLFGATAPDYDARHFEAILAEIDALLPGDDALPDRVDRFRDRFRIPRDRLEAVFDAAIAECRRRTLEYIELPEHESFRIEYVTDKPWSGYNWYQGNAESLIQINTDLPVYISRAVDLGCHEGYPGHHTYNALLERNLVQELGWIEYSLYPLFSPQSLIAEGSANYGIELAFPGGERIEFEKEVLFPIAGLDPAEADRYYRMLELLDRLDYAGNEAARDYLDGDIDRQQAIRWLVDYSLSSPDRARQRTDFFDTYRSYVINYNLGKDLVADYVERDAADAPTRWRRFEHLLSTPMLPSDLQR